MRISDWSSDVCSSDLTGGASIGLSRISRGDSLASSELLRRSDVAMYASKRGGRMRCTWFSDDFDRNREIRTEMEDELRNALVKQEFAVHYQTLVDAKTHEIVAVESLVRWIRPDGKIGRASCRERVWQYV